MSIDLNWEVLTTGPDGLALAEKIRDFVHEKFQMVPLPRFVQSVKVHTFEFGSVAPEIELKDICDPLPDFYEDTDETSESEEEEEDGKRWQTRGTPRAPRATQERERLDKNDLDTTLPRMRGLGGFGDRLSPFLGTNTPGIPGGTSNLNYFHSHLASGLPGTRTPLAAVAGAHMPNGWQDYPNFHERRLGHRHTPSGSSISPPSTTDPARTLHERSSVSTLPPSNVASRPQTREGPPADSENPVAAEEPLSPPHHFREPRVEDLQTVFRVRYSGDVRLSLTAEIFLDYPMPSFVRIPVKLNVTGMSFDGVAILAYIRRKAHFCFLSPEDANTAIGPSEQSEAEVASNMKLGGLIHEIKVESEIGQRENGKQVLKNVGKVERFVLEQVTRIFEDEFVYPSFWTFLV
ncbi:hypothetical protein F5884DRAFT_788111 [Xylogone sp. PMI_703]|nr:hypothetical protein F5884DRAFT_788111 [Xylogone sp. PMI_703]